MNRLKELYLQRVYISDNGTQLLFWLTKEEQASKYHLFDRNDPVLIPYYAYGTCCTCSWVDSISGIDTVLNGAFYMNTQILEVEEIRLESVEHEGSVTDYSTYHIKTTMGSIKIEFRAEHNGYYGGDLKYGIYHDLDGLKPVLKDFHGKV